MTSQRTKCKATPDVSPPGYPPSRLRPFNSVHYFSLCPTTHIALLLSYANRVWWMSPILGNSNLRATTLFIHVYLSTCITPVLQWDADGWSDGADAPGSQGHGAPQRPQHHSPRPGRQEHSTCDQTARQDQWLWAQSRPHVPRKRLLPGALWL